MSGMPSGPLKGRIRTSAEEPHRRTDWIYLTDLGRQVAEQLQNG
jgi:hypothetical protein